MLQKSLQHGPFYLYFTNSTFFFWSSDITGLVQIKLLFANWQMDRLYMYKQCMPSLLKSTADSYKLSVNSSMVLGITDEEFAYILLDVNTHVHTVSVVADLTEHQAGCVCGC